MKTNWKKYEDALQYLEVHEDGRVRNLRTGNWLKGQNSTTGYLQVAVYNGGKQFYLFVHRLVAIVHVPKPEGWDETWEVNHKNGVKTDCRAENLEWCTHSVNIRHAYLNNLNSRNKRVQMVDITTGDTLSEFLSTNEAGLVMSISQGDISKCCNGKRQTAGGYKWKYKEQNIEQ